MYARATHNLLNSILIRYWQKTVVSQPLKGKLSWSPSYMIFFNSHCSYCDVHNGSNFKNIFDNIFNNQKLCRIDSAEFLVVVA